MVIGFRVEVNGAMRLLLLFIVLLLSVSCRKSVFHIEKSLYSGKLRIDGYYYYTHADMSKSIIFLYRDGVVLHGFDNWPASLDDVDDRINEIFFQDSDYKESYSRWSAFDVQNNKIKYEFVDVIETRLVKTMEGVILNDSTFHITMEYRLNKRGKKRNEYDRDILWRYRAYSPKPDSSNKFIK